MQGLCIHAGAHRVSFSDVAAIPVPEATDTWQPVAHADLYLQIRNRLHSYGMRITDESHAIYRDGARYFGLVAVAPDSELIDNQTPDYDLVIGFRNSHDKSFSASLALGNRVFVCDNLAFSGEITLSHKHTPKILNTFPTLVDRGITALISNRNLQDRRIAIYKQSALDQFHASDLIIRALERGAAPLADLPRIVSEWRAPTHQEFAKPTAWSLYNCFTEVLKGRSLLTLPARTMALNSLFDTEFGVASVLLDNEQSDAIAATPA